uniref:Reverse transcriptase domain-containing protein n=1 Tax=Tanacetum cinerariifolium TaxID=118510 RepID=A0A699HEK6_TANCI|nr:hypothetical protein [Tanacetum cinerariifolium]
MKILIARLRRILKRIRTRLVLRGQALHMKMFPMFSVAAWNSRVLNRALKQSEVCQVVNENQFSICAILESQVNLSSLSKICWRVLRCWEWTTNGSSCEIVHEASNKTIFCSFIYVGNKQIERRILWTELKVHKNVARGFPWILMGDFNVALNLEDTYSGSSSMTSAMCEFKDCITDMEVMDVTRSGIHYTWNQKPKGGGGVLKKLDRIMANMEFIDTFPGAYAIFQPYRISDHSPANSHVDGHNMFKVVSKLKILKKPLRKLLHDQGNLHERVNKLRLELDAVQKALDSNPADPILREEECAYVQAFNEAELNEERLLKQKAKVEWLDAGTSRDCNILNVEDLFSKTIYVDTTTNMVRNVTNDEIKVAMFDIGDDNSPGPDGYTSIFFKKGWNIVGQDVCNAVCDFFSNGLLLKEINHTFVALILKVSTPLRVNNYRPISCCNAIYKCISKIITNRIIDGIKEVVSDNQFAFILGRRISDNILITQELVHNYHRNKGPPRCAYKINIQKAYDTMDWNFLENILIRLGFHTITVKWIMACVSSTSFSLSINGNIHGYFKRKRGLRKGDPLSPYLFTLVMEILTLILKRQVRRLDSFRYHRYCEEAQLINVCFTDDLFIFARGDVESSRVIIKSLEEFKLTSGLVPSTQEDCKILVEKVKNRIGGWKYKSLSFAGRLQLRGKAKIAWDDICLPKCEGGLGLRNYTLITTHIWNIVSFKESLWPQSWLLKAPNIGLIPIPTLDVSQADLRQWHDRNGTLSLFWVKGNSNPVWSYVRDLAGMDLVPPVLHDIIVYLQPTGNKRTTRSDFGKLILESFEDLSRVWSPNREVQARVVLFFPSPWFFPLGFPREGFLRRQSFLDHTPPSTWMVDVAAWKLCKADWDVS